MFATLILVSRLFGWQHWAALSNIPDFWCKNIDI
jgi:hypothetical protein